MSLNADQLTERIAKHEQANVRAQQRHRICDRVGRLLLKCVLATFAAAWIIPGGTWIFSVATGLLMAVLAGIYLVAENSQQQSRFHRNFARIYRVTQARHQRDWDAIPLPRVNSELKESAAARDLDIFGDASLMKVVCTAEIPSGIHRLAEWLLSPASIEEIGRRQMAVQELAPQFDWRIQFQQHCRQLAKADAEVTNLLQWCSDHASNEHRHLPRWVYAISFAFPFVLAGFILLWFIRATSIIGFVGIPLTLLASLALTAVYSGRVHAFFSKISPTSAFASSSALSAPFQGLAAFSPSSALMTEAARVSERAALGLSELERLLRMANISRNAITAGFLYFPLQFLFMWDFHLDRLTRQWHGQFADEVAAWFDLLATQEAIVSLAALADAQPDWTFPQVDASQKSFVAAELGHPLLTNDERVGNDVVIGPRNRVLVLTGSNMSGKSTLLRAIGLNAALAQAGGPVCATKLQMPPVNLLTCMRIGDSLQRGQSFFMAELIRLKEIVSAVDSAAAQFELESPGELVPMYLLDEILHGTNTTERRVAVESVLQHLLTTPAIGAISTHDLELARDADCSDKFEQMHFRETLSEDGRSPELAFDYKLQPGIASTTNALKLVRMMGLPTPNSLSREPT